MNVEEALVIIDTALKPEYLSDLQQSVFRQCWEGKTYAEIAEGSSYAHEYIRDVGFKLWQLLSKAFGEKVTKSNCRTVFRRVQQATVSTALPEITDINVSSQTNWLKAAPNLVDTRAVTANKRQDWGELRSCTSSNNRLEFKLPELKFRADEYSELQMVQDVR